MAIFYADRIYPACAVIYPNLPENSLECSGYSFSRTARKDSSSSAVREVLRTFPLNWLS